MVVKVKHKYPYRMVIGFEASVPGFAQELPKRNKTKHIPCLFPKWWLFPKTNPLILQSQTFPNGHRDRSIEHVPDSSMKNNGSYNCATINQNPCFKIVHMFRIWLTLASIRYVDPLTTIWLSVAWSWKIWFLMGQQSWRIWLLKLPLPCVNIILTNIGNHWWILTIKNH